MVAPSITKRILIEGSISTVVMKGRLPMQYWLKNHRLSHSQHTNRRRRKKNILAVWRLSGTVLSRCFLAPLGVFFVMKTLKNEW